MSNRILVLLFALSLMAVAAVPAVYLLSTPPAEAGNAEFVEASLRQPALTSSATTAVTEPARTDPTHPADPTAPPTTAVPVWSGLLTEDPGGETTVPVSLRMPSIGVEAPIIEAGVDQRTGQMEVPKNVREIAWYEFGPRPGEGGSAVLAAHVDLAGQGPGVFFRLREVDPGQIITVGFSDGSMRHFRVEARAIYTKEELPLDTVFARHGPPVLTLITCGGGFSRAAGSYDSNVVVYATPVSERNFAPTR